MNNVNCNVLRYSPLKNIGYRDLENGVYGSFKVSGKLK